MNLNPYVTRLSAVFEHARRVGELRRDPAASRLWHHVYGPLSEGRPGLLGAMTGRAEAQVMRLACLYALGDQQAQIRDVHLRAALEVWRYCFDSARYIFGDRLGDPVADDLLRALRAAGEAGLTRKDIAHDVFGRNRSPLRTVSPYRVENVRLRTCTPDEIRALVAGLPADLALLARLTLACLLRLSECLALRREDLGPTFAVIVNSKNGRSRRVPLPPELRADLLARCHASGAVFGVGKAGTPPTQQATSLAFTRALRALGLEGISHHTFRHTGASVMVARGVSLRAVQTIGGWQSLRMVERYAHVDDAELQRAVRITQAHTEGITNGGTVTTATAQNTDPKTEAK